MKVTAIRQQVKQPGRYSIYVDGKYTFSLSEAALLESGLASGQELSPAGITDYKRLSGEDKFYNQALRYVAMRPRSVWEMQTYLERKQAPPEATQKIIQKLIDLDLLNDEVFAASFVRDRQLLRPTSKRKLTLELRQKHIPDEIANRILQTLDVAADRSALGAVIEKKRRQSRYQDDTKLMQYLARQGFSYDDIKQALSA